MLKIDSRGFDTVKSRKKPKTQVKMVYEAYTDFLTHAEKLPPDPTVGCLVVAGGQGTRFGSASSKGTYPLTAFKKKSLFQLLAEKTYFASQACGQPLSLAIMTSPLNYAEIKKYFRDHDYFGLQKEQLDFFTQEMLPLEDDEGHSLTEKGPDGNGRALHHFVKRGLYHKWKAKGIQRIHFLLIDNPLADPFDGKMIYLAKKLNPDVIIHAVLRQDPKEKVGIIVKENQRIKVIEYTELKVNEGHHKLANISFFSFSMDFIERASHVKLPLHRVKKKGYWKSEYFIFDVLPFAMKVITLVSPREETFAPLKNWEGPDSIETVRAALQVKDRHTFITISGTILDDRPFELSQAFYYPTEALRKKWEGKSLPPQHYIEG